MQLTVEEAQILLDKIKLGVPRQEWIKEVISKGNMQIVKELEDYWKMMEVYSKVLERVTKGRMSKTSYAWKAISEVLDDIEFTSNTEEAPK